MEMVIWICKKCNDKTRKPPKDRPAPTYPGKCLKSKTGEHSWVKA